MGEVSTIGLDIAKSVFQVHGVDVDGAVVIRKRVSRAKVLEFFSTFPSCLVGIEACPSAHHSTNWRGHDDVMQIRSFRGSGEPVWVIALPSVLSIGTRSAQSIRASGHICRINRPDT